MSRKAIGDRPMTGAERQRRYIAKLKFQLAEALAEVDRLRRRIAAGPAADGRIIQVAHLCRWPVETVMGLRQKLRHRDALALCDGLGRAHEALHQALAAVAPEEPDPPDDA